MPLTTMTLVSLEHTANGGVYLKTEDFLAQDNNWLIHYFRFLMAMLCSALQPVLEHDTAPHRWLTIPIQLPATLGFL